MTHHDERSHSGEKLVHAYNRMMERIKVALEEAGKEGRPTLNHLITTAKEKAVQLGEITQEEADKIGDYLKRDLEDAAAYMASTEAQDFGSWLKFDIRLIEERLLEMFTSVADKTTLELMEFTEGANRYQTGEITGIGTLSCLNCGQLVHFHTTGHIPPCPKCHSTTFIRTT